MHDETLPTRLYVHAVFYDAFEDEIFEGLLPINKLDLKFYNKKHKNLNDLEEIKFSGKIRNLCEGSILLGSL